ncbi:MAG: hypothetical protein JNK60_05350 [Acidobacteria bacterium]|nr:hypothetical protein [Acidobacteriota bacterium]
MPEAPPVMVIQDSEDTAWNEHVGLVVFTANAPLPPAAGNVALAGVSTYEHERPACVMRKRSPPTSIRDERCASSLLGETTNEIEPLPVPELAEVICTQPSSATAFQEQDAPLAMSWKAPLPPNAGRLAAEGDSVKSQPPPCARAAPGTSAPARRRAGIVR